MCGEIRKRKASLRFVSFFFILSFICLIFLSSLFSLLMQSVDRGEWKAKNETNEKNKAITHIHETNRMKFIDRSDTVLYYVLWFTFQAFFFYACTANEMRSIPMMLGRAQNNRHCNLHITLYFVAKLEVGHILLLLHPFFFIANAPKKNENKFIETCLCIIQSIT